MHSCFSTDERNLYKDEKHAVRANKLLYFRSRITYGSSNVLKVFNPDIVYRVKTRNVSAIEMISRYTEGYKS